MSEFEIIDIRNLVEYRDGKRITHTPYGIVTQHRGGDAVVTIGDCHIKCGKSLAPLILARGQVVRHG